MAKAVAKDRVRDPVFGHRHGQGSSHAQVQGYGHVPVGAAFQRTCMGMWTARNRFVQLPRQVRQPDKRYELG
ncbi:hypothetical protein Syun_014157 [Stephania yunnanensis]|uniref:Uncharacterized protein n=1 Tax=Stephania yunnanensis TaxID=152371 RepID=A0AAP0P8H8_9MAGN